MIFNPTTSTFPREEDDDNTKKVMGSQIDMTTRKIGYALAILGAGIFLMSLIMGYVGTGASQILASEIGMVIFLAGSFLAFIYPERKISLWKSIPASVERFLALPPAAWVMLSFLIIYVLFFLSPVFFNAQRSMGYFGRYLPNSQPIGLDIRVVLGYVQEWLVTGQSPYADQFIAYPPLGLLLFTPLLLLGYPAYYFFITFTSLFFYVGSTLIVPILHQRAQNRILILFLFGLGLFSYGFQFELERGQSNIIAFSLALIGVYLYHARDDFDIPAYLLFSIGVQMKIYPAILIVMFIRDWKDWKRNMLRLVGIGLFNVALLFIMGLQIFGGFLGAVKGQQLYAETWNGNHALKGFVFALASGEYKFLGARIITRLERYQGQVELFLLAVLGLSFLAVLLLSYFKGRSGLNPYLVVVCTVCAMVIPSISNDYKLPILTAPLAILWSRMNMPEKGVKRVLSILLVLTTSLAYWSTQYPPGIKPHFLNRNFPALFLVLVSVTILSFITSWQIDPPLEDPGNDRTKEGT